MRCPTCHQPLPKRSSATSFTATRRVERYWCQVCHDFKKGSLARDFDLEDDFADYTGPILWDLGANLPEGHPFAASPARSSRAA